MVLVTDHQAAARSGRTNVSRLNVARAAAATRHRVLSCDLKFHAFHPCEAANRIRARELLGMSHMVCRAAIRLRLSSRDRDDETLAVNDVHSVLGQLDKHRPRVVVHRTVATSDESTVVVPASARPKRVTCAASTKGDLTVFQAPCVVARGSNASSQPACAKRMDHVETSWSEHDMHLQSQASASTRRFAFETRQL